MLGWMTLALVWAGEGSLQADYLRWSKANNRVEAEVTTWDVIPLLRKVAAASGWEIYVEPGTKQVQRTTFKNLPPGEALARLLGPLNFALLPAGKGSARLLVFRTHQREATELVKADESKDKRIEDELVVKLKPGESIEELAKKLGAKVIGQLDGKNTYRLKFADAASAEAARAALQGNSAVASVDNNYLIDRPTSPQGLGAGVFPSLHPKAVGDGKYVIVGLIDTALQPKEGRFGDLLLPGISVAGTAETPTDAPTHGTAMAETLLKSLAQLNTAANGTTVRILPVDVYGGSESASTFDLSKGIYEAVNKGAMIINISGGGKGDAPYLQDVIASSRQQGVLFVAAAGNEPDTTPTYPAAYKEVIGVTAETPDGQIADYANKGAFATVGAPDKSIIGFGNTAYVVTGTSVSTANISGMLAGLKEQSGGSAAELEAAIRKAMAVRPPAPAGK